MREKLIELIASKECDYYSGVYEEWIEHDCEKCGVANCSVAQLADHLIANGVTIPIRCQDCKHWKNEINGCTEDKRFCDIGFYMVHKDGFCSFGEKKDGDQNG